MSFAKQIVLFLTSQSAYLLSPCLTALVRTSSTLLKRSGKREHPCLVPDLSGKALSFSPLSRILAVSFYRFFYNEVGKLPLYFWFTEDFYHEYCWILSNAISVSIDMIM